MVILLAEAFVTTLLHNYTAAKTCFFE